MWRIGLTYDLRTEYLAAGYTEEQTAELDRPETIDAIAEAIESLGHQVERIGSARRLIERLAEGQRWDLVFNFAEGIQGRARESQVPCILDVFGIPYTFSDPLVMAICLDKWLAKLVLRQAGLPTPDFVLVERPEQAAAIQMEFPLFVKPAAEGTGKGISPASIVEDQASLVARCEELLERFGQPVLVETYLPGREFTVGLVGTGSDAWVLGTLEIRLRPTAEPNVYSYQNKEYCEERVDYLFVRPEEDPVVAEAEQIALAAWRLLGCRDAGRLDLRCDTEGRPQFLEANPLAGLHPTHSDLPMICSARGIPYQQLIDWIIQSAAQRIKPAQAHCQPLPVG
ncbi:MAG: ATP-grasp domain-containing protein [Thermoguttaceae bacterium]|nr:ATP-grasp domain-containing protein [Thermoguttaceae bacterium]MDW8037463.1 ATP-grasp domain-containing protein [Thermoguttaceae bacterium]